MLAMNHLSHYYNNLCHVYCCKCKKPFIAIVAMIVLIKKPNVLGLNLTQVGILKMYFCLTEIKLN